MSNRTYDLSEARAKRVSERIIRVSQPCTYQDILECMAAEDVERPKRRMERLISLLYDCGYQGLAINIGCACAYEAWRRNEERSELVAGIYPFIAEIARHAMEDVD